MHFSFFDLIAHIARTRAFTAGTILGSGTVSNADRARGVSCLAERRMIETIDGGKRDDAVHGGRATRSRSRCATRAGRDVFGRIEQQVVAAMILYDYWRSSSAWRVRIALH